MIAVKEAERILKKHNSSIPVNVEKIIQLEGICLRPEKLEDTVSGMLVMKENKAVIVVNSNHPKNRQRFTMAHELGHYLLHRKYANVFFDESLVFFRDDQSSEGKKYQEIEANRFAAELLMPESFLKKQLKSSPFDAFDDSNQSSLKELAKQLKVSVQALTIRLTSLNLISV